MRVFTMMQLMFIGVLSYGQNVDELFSFNHRLPPIGYDDIDYNKTDIGINIPIKFKKGIILNTLNFNYFQFNYHNTNFGSQDLTLFYDINYGLRYVYSLNKKWSIDLSSGIAIASNLESSFTSEDLFFNGDFTIVKKGNNPEKPSLLKLGIGYATLTGEPKIIPLISYYKQLNNNFSFCLGFPESYTKYKLNEKHSLKFSILIDGYYGNLSKPVYTDTYNSFDKVKLVTCTTGLEYNYWMGDFWTIVFKAGHSSYNKYELLNKNNNETYSLDLGNTLFFSSGVKFNLKNKYKKQKKNGKQ